VVEQTLAQLAGRLKSHASEQLVVLVALQELFLMASIASTARPARLLLSARLSARSATVLESTPKPRLLPVPSLLLGSIFPVKSATRWVCVLKITSVPEESMLASYAKLQPSLRLGQHRAFHAFLVRRLTLLRENALHVLLVK